MATPCFLDESRSWDGIAANASPDPARLDEILAKGLEGKGLDSADVAVPERLASIDAGKRYLYV